MQIELLAIGTKMPNWVKIGYEEYAKRLPKDCELLLKELPMAQRGKAQSVEVWKEKEAETLLKALKPKTHIVVLDEHAKMHTTLDLAERLQSWRETSSHISLIIGGPDGLSSKILDKAHETWSLSPLTLPHPLVRIIVAEQLYRAWSVLQGSPYHRA